MGDLAVALVERGLDAQVALEVEALLEKGDFDTPDYLDVPKTGETLEHDGSLMFRFGRLVIRHDDLQLLNHLGQSATTAAGVGFFIGQTSSTTLYGAMAGMIVGGLKFLNQVRRKAAVVEPDQYVILGILKHRALLADELQALLDAHEPDLWPQERVTAELNRLKTVRLRDGNVAAFVAESDGKWGTCGI